MVKNAEAGRTRGHRTPARLVRRALGRSLATRPLLHRFAHRFGDPIATEPGADEMTALRSGATIGGPLGSGRFLGAVAARTGHGALPHKRGR